MGRNVVRLGQGQDEMIGDVKNIIKHLEASASLERVEAILKDHYKQLQPRKLVIISLYSNVRFYQFRQVIFLISD